MTEEHHHDNTARRFCAVRGQAAARAAASAVSGPARGEEPAARGRDARLHRPWLARRLPGADHRGDSGIGRAVAVAFAKEGADVAIAYLSEQEDGDAQHTAELVGKAGRRCVTIRGDLAEEAS